MFGAARAWGVGDSLPVKTAKACSECGSLRLQFPTLWILVRGTSNNVCAWNVIYDYQNTVTRPGTVSYMHHKMMTISRDNLYTLCEWASPVEFKIYTKCNTSQWGQPCSWQSLSTDQSSYVPVCCEPAFGLGFHGAWVEVEVEMFEITNVIISLSDRHIWYRTTFSTPPQVTGALLSHPIISLPIKNHISTATMYCNMSAAKMKQNFLLERKYPHFE